MALTTTTELILKFDDLLLQLKWFLWECSRTECSCKYAVSNKRFWGQDSSKERQVDGPRTKLCLMLWLLRPFAGHRLKPDLVK